LNVVYNWTETCVALTSLLIARKYPLLGCPLVGSVSYSGPSSYEVGKTGLLLNVCSSLFCLNSHSLVKLVYWTAHLIQPVFCVMVGGGPRFHSQVQFLGPDPRKGTDYSIVAKLDVNLWFQFWPAKPVWRKISTKIYVNFWLRDSGDTCRKWRPNFKDHSLCTNAATVLVRPEF
jgi:hypothetical protein